MDERLRLLRKLNRMFMEHVPHNVALGIELLTLDDGAATMRLPYRLDLVGNPDTGVLHGGAISALLDACCGASVFMKLSEPMPIATLDLRIDYLRPATPERAVIAEAECYRRSKNVAFSRCVAFHEDDRDDLIASATGAFMLATKMGGSK